MNYFVENKYIEFLSNYYGFHRGGDRKSNTKLLCLNEVDSPQNQVELAQSYGIKIFNYILHYYNKKQHINQKKLKKHIQLLKKH